MSQDRDGTVRPGSKPFARNPEAVTLAAAEQQSGNGRPPRIAAFIWGGKVRPAPTLPYGRWKGAA